MSHSKLFAVSLLVLGLIRINASKMGKFSEADLWNFEKLWMHRPTSINVLLS